MNVREASVNDFEQMHEVRMAVTENILPDRSLITRDDYNLFLNTYGKGWVCETDNNIVGFSIVDLKEKNVWALFIKPGFEGRGIGQQLHNIMLNWYFENSKEDIWLGTSAGTRAEKFYYKAGWKATGTRKNGEIKFEMSYKDWKLKNLV